MKHEWRLFICFTSSSNKVQMMERSIPESAHIQSRGFLDFIRGELYKFVPVPSVRLKVW